MYIHMYGAYFNLGLVCDCRGVGCIFIEMLTGKPLFPGIKGVYDQLNKIWSVSDLCTYIHTIHDLIRSKMMQVIIMVHSTMF